MAQLAGVSEHISCEANGLSLPAIAHINLSPKSDHNNLSPQSDLRAHNNLSPQSDLLEASESPQLSERSTAMSSGDPGSGREGSGFVLQQCTCSGELAEAYSRALHDKDRQIAELKQQLIDAQSTVTRGRQLAPSEALDHSVTINCK